FQFVRHPIYLAMVLLALGTVLWIPNLYTVLGAVVMAIGSDLRGRAEEKLMLLSFGDTYRNYMGRVKRFVPGIY
ncbi:MAG: isoprenylcysteine carboxylmethyltransferase family protein, partial [Acidobacteriota bacterium]|nr:isoprenylcysteine carboxylmethyltransferase family protein [Acidobacteriota bacterium]